MTAFQIAALAFICWAAGYILGHRSAAKRKSARMETEQAYMDGYNEGVVAGRARTPDPRKVPKVRARTPGDAPL